jgi:hypothetical protein
MSDGTRLSARIWLPADAVREPVPAILEYIPYRKGDGTVLRDAQMHPYFAGHGYAAVRVDLRGSGDSEGVLRDEYLTQEHDDALEVLAWLERQPWCSGRAGIIGKSWGGFNGLQIAARRPPQLAAVISVCSTDDRYTDDVHYLGGAVLAAKMLPWAATMLGFNALPPDPAVVGEAWRAMWQQRLEGSPPFAEEWLAHQRRDEYWKHGSVRTDYSAISCPVYAVGGWADAYSNAIPRLLAGLAGPRKGLIGPWGHQYPHSGIPGPAIGFLQECLRWWDHWLKGADTGIMAEPMLRAWLQGWTGPDDDRSFQPGRWVAEPSWPMPDMPREYRLGAGELTDDPGPDRRLPVPGGAEAGLSAGDWCPAAAGPGDLPADQRDADAESLCFDSRPLAEPVDLLGFTAAVLRVASSGPSGNLIVRLCDVAPDNSSLLITRGVLNLCHAGGHQSPAALRPGQWQEVTVTLNAIAAQIPAGHRLRLAVSAGYWPWVWPPAQPVTLALLAGGRSRLILPVRGPRAGDASLPPFGQPEVAPSAHLAEIAASPTLRSVRRDAATGAVEVVRSSREVTRLPGSGLVKKRERTETCTLRPGDPLSAAVRTASSHELARDGWQVRIETSSAMTADATSFHLMSKVEAFEGQARVYSRTRETAIPRDHC